MCGSAPVMKGLHETLEKDSKSLGLCENQYPDINVPAGLLKDYLQERPSLRTKQLYELCEAVFDATVKSSLKTLANIYVQPVKVHC